MGNTTASARLDWMTTCENYANHAPHSCPNHRGVFIKKSQGRPEIFVNRIESGTHVLACEGNVRLLSIESANLRTKEMLDKPSVNKYGRHPGYLMLGGAS